MSDTCRRGHPFTLENTGTSITSNGRLKRYCRTCQRANAKARRDSIQGQPCTNCRRTGIYLGTGGWCLTCARRRAKGLPLDAPIGPAPKQQVKKPPRKPKLAKATKPTPSPGPAASSNLPPGWFDTKPERLARRKTAVSMKDDVRDVGAIPAIPPDQLAAVRRLLARHSATDLADILIATTHEHQVAPAGRTWRG